MKLLLETNKKGEADTIRALLESRGIPVFVGGRSAWYTRFSSDSGRYALWVVLERQWGDAQALLHHPAHEVSMPVDVAEFHWQFEQFRSANEAQFANRAMLMVVFALTAALGAFFLMRVPIL